MKKLKQENKELRHYVTQAGLIPWDDREFINRVLSKRGALRDFCEDTGWKQSYISYIRHTPMARNTPRVINLLTDLHKYFDKK